MQSALRARDEKDADYRGQIAAIGRAQAVIEFDMDGTVREVNDNFVRVMGYTRAEVIGKHHSMFVRARRTPPAPSIARFWSKLNRGEIRRRHATSASARAAAKSGCRPRTTRSPT